MKRDMYGAACMLLRAHAYIKTLDMYVYEWLKCWHGNHQGERLISPLRVGLVSEVFAGSVTVQVQASWSPSRTLQQDEKLRQEEMTFSIKCRL